MRILPIMLAGVVLAGLVRPVMSDEEEQEMPVVSSGKTTRSLPSLSNVTWADRPVTFEGLRGKTVVVLVYATWHPSFNELAGGMLDQLKQAIRNKPVVVLAIDTGKKGESGEAYMKERKFLAPNIIHGRDPLMPARLGLKSELFQYALISPEGQVVESGHAEMFFEDPQRKFVLPLKLAKSKNLGSFQFLDDKLSPKVKELLWPLELGQIRPESEFQAAKQELAKEEQDSLAAAIERFLTAELDRIRKLSEGKPADRLSAHERATLLAAGYSGHDQAQEAKDLAKELARDPGLKRELAAKRAYDKLLQRTSNNPAAGSRAMADIAKLYRGTYYGALAANGGVAPDDKGKLNSIRTWPVLTNAQQKDAVEEEREYYAKVRQKLSSVKFQAYETKRFLYYSDISADIINKLCLPYLDQMYVELCKAYSLDPNTNIWKGKAAIYAFAHEEDFHAFNMEFFHSTLKGAQGVCHQIPDGTVVIACFAGPDANYFAAVMVHETTHGFAFRYKSGDHLPNWLDEGAADWVANKVVGGSDAIRMKVQLAIARMQRTHNLGGDFFTRHNIDAWQYGVASSMTDFLLKYDPAGQASKTSSRKPRAKTAANNLYRKFVEAIKLGEPWEDALLHTYKMTPEQLTAAYGRSISIPDLKP